MDQVHPFMAMVFSNDRGLLQQHKAKILHERFEEHQKKLINMDVLNTFISLNVTNAE